MLGDRQPEYVNETLENWLTKLVACKRGNRAGVVMVPVIITDNLPFSVALPETSALSQLLWVTLQRMLAATLLKVRSPLMVSVPLGASVPSMVVPLVVPTVAFPVNVPDLYK